MALPETFPDPDPMLRFVDPDDLPLAFQRMTPEDRWRRLRLFLIARASIGPHFIPVLWNVAFDFTPEGEAYARDVVDIHDDATIEAMVADGAQRWAAFDRARARGEV